MSSYVFAMSGQKIYLEMMAEMRRPEQFPRSLYTATPTVLLSYAFVCGTGYILRGDRVPRYLMAVLQYDVKRSVSNFLMLIHIVISYVLNQQVLCRVRLHSLACSGCRTRVASLSRAPAPAPASGFGLQLWLWLRLRLRLSHSSARQAIHLALAPERANDVGVHSSTTSKLQWFAITTTVM